MIRILKVFLAASCLGAVRAETVVFVGPPGSGSGTGSSREAPLDSLDRAAAEIRRLKSAGVRGPFAVEILPGTYVLPQGFRLGPDDSGEEGVPVAYRASEPGTVRLTGARTLPPAAFRPAAGLPLADRLDPDAREHVMALDLKAAGLRHAGPFPDRFDGRGGIFELFDAHGRMPLSRWPNEGSALMKRVVEVGDQKVPGIFEYHDDRPARWLKNDHVWLRGQWRVGWEDPALRVATIDPAARTMAFAAGVHNGIGSKYHRPHGSGEEPWHALNLPEEIDRPGEWAIDFASGTLLVWPRDPGSDLLVTQCEEPLVSVAGAHDLTFSGLVLEHSLGDGFVLEDVLRCRVAGCTVQDIAGRGIVLHGRQSAVQSCDVREVGEGAIYVSGGDRKSLTPSGNTVINNHVHHYGLLRRQYSAGVHVGVMGNPAGGNALRDAVGIRVAHNVIHHAPRDAILYSGNDNVYEYNEIYFCGFDTKDTGAFYSWLDWTMRGNVIRYNFIHDTVGGVNPDDGASGNLVHGNVFAGPRIGVWIASGPDNVIRHNIFVKEEGAVFGMDDRGVSRGYASNPRLIQRLNELHPAEEPWKSAHPELAAMLDNRPELPWRTQFVGNLIVSPNPAPSSLKMKPEFRADPRIILEKDNVTVAEDPGFLNAREMNFALPRDADVLSRIPGFEPIPFEKIGLQVDEFRRTLPTESQRQRGREHNPFPADTDRNFGT